MAGAIAGGMKRGLEPIAQVAGCSRAGLRHQQPEAGRPQANRTIGRPCLFADQVRQLMRDGISRAGIRGAADLEEQHGCRPAVARMSRRLVAERGRPVGPGIEVLRRLWAIDLWLRLPGTAGGMRRTIEECHDSLGCPLVMVRVRQDKAAGPARFLFGWGRNVVGRVGQGPKSSRAGRTRPDGPGRASESAASAARGFAQCGLVGPFASLVRGQRLG